MILQRLPLKANEMGRVTEQIQFFNQFIYLVKF